MIKNRPFRILITIIVASLSYAGNFEIATLKFTLSAALAQVHNTTDIISEFRTRLSNAADLKNYSASASMRSDGALIISGRTARPEDKDRILQIAKNIPGVRLVQDHIVVYSSFGETVFTDAEVTSHVHKALELSNTSIPEFSVKEGIVYLSGDFSSFTDVDKISSIILSSEGVKDLKSNITVNGKDYLTSFKREFKEMPRGDAD